MAEGLRWTAVWYEVVKRSDRNVVRGGTEDGKWSSPFESNCMSLWGSPEIGLNSIPWEVTAAPCAAWVARIGLYFPRKRRESAKAIKGCTSPQEPMVRRRSTGNPCLEGPTRCSADSAPELSAVKSNSPLSGSISAELSAKETPTSRTPSPSPTASAPGSSICPRLKVLLVCCNKCGERYHGRRKGPGWGGAIVVGA